VRFLARAEKDHPAALTAIKPSYVCLCGRLPSFNMVI
jgi:hypothetical protein